MKAVTLHGKRDVRVDTVPDPTIEEPTDAIVRDHVDRALRLGPAPVRGARPVHGEGDILGHEPMGIVEEVGAEVTTSRRRPRGGPVQHLLRALLHVRPRLQSQCETTQVREQGKGAALFGYTKLYGQVPGGQAEFLRVPQAAVRPDQGARRPARRPVPVPVRRPADGVAGGRVRRRSRPAARVAVLGLGPIGEMSCPDRAAPGRRQVIGVDLVPERLERGAGARRRDVDLRRVDDVAGGGPRA